MQKATRSKIVRNDGNEPSLPGIAPFGFAISPMNGGNPRPHRHQQGRAGFPPLAGEMSEGQRGGAMPTVIPAEINDAA